MTNVIPFPSRPDRDRNRRTATRTDNDSGRQVGTVTPIDGVAVYTVAEVARMLSLSTGTTYRLIRKGDIPARKMGAQWVIPKRRFDYWLDHLPEASPEEVDREFAKHLPEKDGA